MRRSSSIIVFLLLFLLAFTSWSSAAASSILILPLSINGVRRRKHKKHGRLFLSFFFFFIIILPVHMSAGWLAASTPSLPAPSVGWWWWGKTTTLLRSPPSLLSFLLALSQQQTKTRWCGRGIHPSSRLWGKTQQEPRGSTFSHSLTQTPGGARTHRHHWREGITIIFLLQPSVFFLGENRRKTTRARCVVFILFLLFFFS